MPALHAGILIANHSTLEDVTPIRARLEAGGAQVTVLVPSGGSVLPVSGRYYPAAGELGARRALTAVNSGDLDLLVLPDAITGEELAQIPHALALLRDEQHLLPVFRVSQLTALLDHNIPLTGLAAPESALAGRG